MRSIPALLTLAVAVLTLLGTSLAAVSMSAAAEGAQCQFPDGAVGRCEEVGSCLDARGVVKRNDRIVLCSNTNSLKVVACCRRPHWVAEEMCTAWARYWRQKTAEGNQTCSSSQPLIHGGEEAGLGEFPHMAALGEPTSEVRVTWMCGGSLITPSFVLTAAHCVIYQPKVNPKLVVVLGEHDLTFQAGDTTRRLDLGLPEGLESAPRPRQLGQSSPVHQRFNVSEIFIYPEYRYKNFYHDIALLKLQSPAVLTDRVLPACLPTRVAHQYTSESSFTVAGWGNYIYGTPLSSHPSQSQKLQKVNIDYIDSIKCEHEIQKLNSLGYPQLGITSDMICAGAPQKDSCMGDSGGPLMQKVQLAQDGDGLCQPQMVAGIVSFAPRDCDSLGVYTRVASYLDWITGIVAPRLLPLRVN